MGIKKVLLVLFLLIHANVLYGQKQFPIKVDLRDTLNKKVNTNVVMYNINKPIIVVIWASFIQSNIDLLDSFEEIYPEWKKKYGVKIIAISIEKKHKRKNALKLINDKKWSFSFYFDHQNKFFIKSSPSNAVPQILIYDKNYHLIERFKHTISNYTFDNDDVIEMPNKVKKINLTNKFSNLDCDLTPYENVLEFIKSKN
jgi:thiol-disulfide isomerase/thioredoxin